MKHINSMTPEEISDFMTLAGKATASIMPEGAVFMLVVFTPDARASYVSSAEFASIPPVLRGMADRLEENTLRRN